MGEHTKVVTELGKLLKIEPGNTEALLMRGWAYLYLGDEETGTRHFREVLRFDPEHSEAKAAHKKIKSIAQLRKKAQDAMAVRDSRGAEAAFAQAIAVDPSMLELNHTMQRELCRLRLEIGKIADAIQSCDAALNKDSNLLDCSINKVSALMKLERWEEAANLARALAQAHRGNGQVHQVYNEAEQALRISKRKDYYKVLQVDRHADADAIKRQYRNLARIYHPDKVTGSEAHKAEAEVKFREVAEAYEILSDQEKRSRFDRGEDPNEQPQGGGGGGFHHHQQHFHHW
jgi:DnaJ family protein C protein 3